MTRKRKKILKIDNKIIEAIEFGEIAIKYEHGNPVAVVERKKVKLNDEIYTKETTRVFVS